MKKTAVELLAMDFRRWGRRATKRVQAMTLKHGVIFEFYMTNDGSKG